MQQRYHLTEREQMVIIYLMLGFADEEMANRINLSEYTVKEHLKRIIRETQTTTRTGLLARMISRHLKGPYRASFLKRSDQTSFTAPPALKNYVHSVYLVYLVCLVCLVVRCSAELDEPDRPRSVALVP